MVQKRSIYAQAHPTNPPCRTFTLPRATLSCYKRCHHDYSKQLPLLHQGHHFCWWGANHSCYGLAPNSKNSKFPWDWFNSDFWLLLRKAEPSYVLAPSSLLHCNANLQTKKKKPNLDTSLSQPSSKHPPGGLYTPPGWAGLDPGAARLQFSSLSQQQFNPSGAVRWVFANSVNHHASLRHIPSAPH